MVERDPRLIEQRGEGLEDVRDARSCLQRNRNVVDGGPRHGVASTVIDATVDPPVLLRAGGLPPSVLGL